MSNLIAEKLFSNYRKSKPEHDSRISWHSDGVTIMSAYKLSVEEIFTIIGYIKQSSLCPVYLRERTHLSIENEVFAHNMMYKLHMFRDHTADVDLDNEEWYHKMIYCVLGTLYKIPYWCSESYKFLKGLCQRQTL